MFKVPLLVVLAVLAWLFGLTLLLAATLSVVQQEKDLWQTPHHHLERHQFHPEALRRLP